MATTTNFGWETPDDTDLVKDGAAAVRTLGSAIDTSLVDLKGGTTGQILSKNSNTDMDFVWIANDQGDITAVTAGTGITGGGSSGSVTITNDMATTITAAGDIVVGTGNATYDNLPIGTTGQVLTADTTVSPYKVKWASVSSGGVTLIGTYSANNTATTLTISSIPGTYKHLLLVGTGLQSAQTGSSLEKWDIGFNSNTTGSNYHFYGAKSYSNASISTITSGGAGSAKYFLLASQTSGSASTYGACAVWIYDYTSTGQKAITINSVHGDTVAGSDQSFVVGQGKYLEAAAISSIEIKDTDNTVNLKAGTFKLYGVS